MTLIVSKQTNSEVYAQKKNQTEQQRLAKTLELLSKQAVHVRALQEGLIQEVKKTLKPIQKNSGHSPKARPPTGEPPVKRRLLKRRAKKQTVSDDSVPLSEVDTSTQNPFFITQMRKCSVSSMSSIQEDIELVPEDTEVFEELSRLIEPSEREDTKPTLVTPQKDAKTIILEPVDDSKRQGYSPTKKLPSIVDTWKKNVPKKKVSYQDDGGPSKHQSFGGDLSRTSSPLIIPEEELDITALEDDILESNDNTVPLLDLERLRQEEEKAKIEQQEKKKREEETERKRQEKLAAKEKRRKEKEESRKENEETELERRASMPYSISFTKLVAASSFLKKKQNPTQLSNDIRKRKASVPRVLRSSNIRRFVQEQEQNKIVTDSVLAGRRRWQRELAIEVPLGLVGSRGELKFNMAISRVRIKHELADLVQTHNETVKQERDKAEERKIQGKVDSFLASLASEKELERKKKLKSTMLKWTNLISFK